MPFVAATSEWLGMHEGAFLRSYSAFFAPPHRKRIRGICTPCVFVCPPLPPRVFLKSAERFDFRYPREGYEAHVGFAFLTNKHTNFISD